MDIVKAGESASIFGVSGVGKSNLFNHLLDRRVQVKYLDPEADRYIFVRVNFHYVSDFSSRSVYSLILEQLEMLRRHAERLGISERVFAEIGSCHDRLLAAGNDVQMMQRQFKLGIRALLGPTNKKIVFLFDQFDEVYRHASPSLFSSLRGLRESYKYRTSYLVFTRNPLDLLMNMDRARDEFYELVASNEHGLTPYNTFDARDALIRICERIESTFDNSLLPIYMHLTGGHVGLLRTSFMAFANGETTFSRDVEHATRQLLATAAVEAECNKIWISLADEEKHSLANLVHRNTISTGTWLSILQQKGILTIPDEERDSQPEFFSTLFHLYAGRQVDIWPQRVRMDEVSRQIWILDRLCPSLSSQEHHVFRVLYRRMGQSVNRAMLMRAAWPDSRHLSDAALEDRYSKEFEDILLKLSKKIEPNPDEPVFIEMTPDHMAFRLNG
jgi:hypothetical protein